MQITITPVELGGGEDIIFCVDKTIDEYPLKSVCYVITRVSWQLHFLLIFLSH